MKFSEQEMNFLCRLLHYSKLIGYENFPLLNKEESKKVMAKLEEKNIIKDGLLTKYGLTLIRFISLYNKSRKFLKIGSTNYANYQKNEYVMINMKESNFEILPVNQDQITISILTKFSDQYSNLTEGNIKKKLFSRRHFIEFMNEHPDTKALYYYKLDLDEKSECSATLFIDDNVLKHYDSVLEEMTIYTKAHVQHGIESIFK